MTDTLIDRRDLAFQLYEVLDTESLSERERFSEHSRDTFDAVITEMKEDGSLNEMLKKWFGEDTTTYE